MHGRSGLTKKARRSGPAGMQKATGQNDGRAAEEKKNEEKEEKRREERDPWYRANTVQALGLPLDLPGQTGLAPWTLGWPAF